MASFTHCADTERVHQMAEALDTVQGVLGQKFFDFLVAVDVYFPNFTDEELTWAISLLHIAQGINAATGGNDVEPGMIEYSPDVYEHLWYFVPGGIGRFFGQIYETGEKTVTGRAAELEPENIPWVRSFFGRMDDDDKRAEYYRQREEVQAAKQALKEYRDSGRGGDAKAFVERNPVQFRSISAFDAAEKQLRKIRKAKRAIDLSTELSRAEKDEKLAPLKKAEIEIMNGSRRVYARERARLQETRP